jgi:hypothetical protein
LGARVGAFVFATVLALSVWHGVEPGSAFLRASLALLSIMGCGWLAERAAHIKPNDKATEGEEPAVAGTETAEQT